MSEKSVQLKYMLLIDIRTPLKVIFDTNNIICGLFRLSIQYISQLLTVLSQISQKTAILTCRVMCIENESKGKYICSHAPYTPFTSVYKGPAFNITPGIRTNTYGAATLSPDDKQDALVHGDTRKERITSSTCK